MIGYVKSPVSLDSTFIVIEWSKMNNKSCHLQSLSCRNNNIATNLDKGLRNFTLQVITFVYYRDDKNHLNKNKFKLRQHILYILIYDINFRIIFSGPNMNLLVSFLSTAAVMIILTVECDAAVNTENTGVDSAYDQALSGKCDPNAAETGCNGAQACGEDGVCRLTWWMILIIVLLIAIGIIAVVSCLCRCLTCGICCK